MGNGSKSFVLILVVIFLTALVTLQPATVKAQFKTIIVPYDYQLYHQPLETPQQVTQ